MLKLKQTLCTVVMLLTATMLVWGGVAHAYLAKGGVPYVIKQGDAFPDYLTTPNWANSPPLRKFVDTLPLAAVPSQAAGAKNNLQQYIPVAVPDIVSYPGSDYYVIELVQFTEQMHTDLPPTALRGYKQTNNGTATDPGTFLCGGVACTPADNSVVPDTQAHYLGPLIVAQKDRPVRVKFVNNLPTGAGGDLFIPVDTSVMGAGAYAIDYDPATLQSTALNSGTFKQNRAELHLHGGRTPWISDGTPHQWITPAGESTTYPRGVSVVNVPDMPDPGPGAQTYYWTNQQSSRMMFYHDHAWGITRLNVYAGEAAGYLIQDQTEVELINAGILPADQIPLVIQDKTFVDADPASPNYVLKTDPTWNWGTNPRVGGIRAPKTGDLWWPHVYMPAQNPFDLTGIAPMGRWAYGPYFWPATNNPFQPVPNPYYNAACDINDPAQNETNTAGYTTIPVPGGGSTPYCQPPEIPSTPNPSWGAEAFMDTPMVNGTVYPVLDVQPKAYRLRMLNAAHDRFFNLSMFVADATVDPNTPMLDDPATPNDEAALTTASASLCATFTGGCQTETEVRMLPAVTVPGMPETWPADGREGGFPDFDPAKLGPNWVMIGTEGGFLPQPVIIPPNPVTWNNDVTTFNAGNVNGGSLILGPAERADVIVDFSAFAGQTLILYNDAPAPWPALDPHYDYFTGSPDMTEAGGAPPTLPGVGPNTRTIMKIRVAAGTPAPFDLPALQAIFDPAPAAPDQSVFEKGQDPIIVGQTAYNTTYDTTFPGTWPNWGVSRINDKSISFKTLNADGTVNPTPLTVAMKAKAIQDEQGETFDEYGRMRAALGLTLSDPAAGQVNFIVQTYSDPSTEVVNPNEIQIWKITHNGVDTHPVHFHLFDVQVLNRVGWDGFIRTPDPTELGWKDTVRVSPLEDTIVALKPVTPSVPFGLPESYRPLNPATPLGDTTELSPVDPVTGELWATPNVNRMLNFDWEYVWHCHILSHEENDMMRPIKFQFVENKPDAPTSLAVTPNGPNRFDLVWGDPTPVNYVTLTNLGNPKNEIGFRIQRSTNGGAYQTIATTLANATTYSDTTATSGSTYNYRVVTYNAAGDSQPSYMLPSALTLTAAPTAPKMSGTVVTFTAGASGGTGSYQYKFFVKAPGATTATMVRDYSPTKTYAWTAPATTGDYLIGIHVRNVGSTASVEAQKWITYKVLAASAPATGATLTNTPTSPKVPGTVISFTAGGSGGSGTYEYQFLIKGPGATVPTMVKAYSTSNALQWTTPAGLGIYSIGVQVRNLGSTASFEAQKWTSFEVVATAIPATGITLTANPTSPRPQGTEITFTAAATGGSGANEYQFFIKTPGALTGTLVKSYSLSNTYQWTAPTTPGTYSIGVQARNRGSNAPFDVQKWVNYTIQ